MFDFLKSALIAVDVQNDFCPGGALGVDEGDQVVEPINRLAEKIAKSGGKIIATQDWHPADHVSFASSHTGRKIGDIIDLPDVKAQVLWPTHCVQGSEGACFHKNFNANLVNFILRKGFRRQLDSYSAFFENDRSTPTGLDGFLKGLGLDTAIFGGIATDYCIFYSAMDAVRLGYKTIVASDAVRGVGFPDGSVEKAIKAMQENGIIFKTSHEICEGIL